MIQVEGLAGRVAVVTGAGRGIGQAIAEVLAGNGAKVAAFDLEAPAHDGILGVACDVSDEAAVAAAFDRVEAELGAVSVLVLNAGIFPIVPFEETTRELWDRTMAINLTGVYLTIREAARLMKAGGPKEGRSTGSIVATSSNAALVCEPIVGMPYMAAKAGLAHMVRHVALELAEYRIRVNAIAPGPFVTNIGGGWLKDPVVREAWDSAVPLVRIAETYQIKPLALYLASDASSYMTGSQVLIDGGMALGKFG